MKTASVFVLALLLSVPLSAQETLIDGDVDFGGFGGPTVQFTSINKQFGVLAGGVGGVIIDHTFVLGGAGYGLVNNVTEESAPITRPYLNLGYGGGYLQYIHESDNLIHMTAGVLIGAGGVGFRRDFEDDDQWDERDLLNDFFFVVEPDIQAELNITKYFRVAVGGGYRFVSGIELSGLANSDIGGPNGRLMLKFGSF